MSAKISSYTVRNFKQIESATVFLGKVNVLVGANNQGKTSLIQALHFGIGLLQTVRLLEMWPNPGKSNFSSSLNASQVIYSPSEDLYALGSGGSLRTDEEKGISVEINLDSGESTTINVRKGKNRNIAISFTNPDVAYGIADVAEPYSIFSPGLAGVAKTESYISDGVIIRALARGDANILLRNILYRLHQSRRWGDFEADLKEIFPDLNLEVKFDINTDEIIEVMCNKNGITVPLELSGTGALQAIQIFAYIHQYKPKLIVLDEPDSHLHPNNQRLLSSLLQKVSDERGVQVLLTTHSRHVIDALGSKANYIWMQNGAAQSASLNDNIDILIDLGALDLAERVGHDSHPVVILTEDEISRPIVSLAINSGFDMDKVLILPYFGATDPKNLHAIANLIRKQSPQTKIIVHRDRDGLTDTLVEDWKRKTRESGAIPFVTSAMDADGEFIDARHLAECNNKEESYFEKLIEDTFEANRDALEEFFIKAVIDAQRKARINDVPPERAPGFFRALLAKNKRAAFGSKKFLKMLRAEYQIQHGQNLIDVAVGPAQSEELSLLATSLGVRCSAKQE